MHNTYIMMTLSILAGLFSPLQAVPANYSDKEIRIAVRAHAGEQRAIKKWGATITYLNRTLPQYTFVMLPYTSLQQQMTDARAKRFHFVLTNPSTYVELEVGVGARAILTLINNRHGSAQTRFGSVIFTHVDHTDILEIKNLKGKDFVGVNPLGFGGWRVGLKVLQTHGIEPASDFTGLSFAGNQPKVVEAVMTKQAHAGIVRTDMLERLAAKEKLNLRNVRILNPQTTTGFPFFHSSPLYPEWPFAVMPDTAPQLTEQVRQTLLKIKQTDPAAVTGQYVGWTPALDYQPVKDLLHDIGVAPFAKPKTGLWFVYLFVCLSVLLIAFYVFKRYSNQRAA